MKTFKLKIYTPSGRFIRDIWGDFKSKRQAISWAISQHKDIGIPLTTKDILVIEL